MNTKPILPFIDLDNAHTFILQAMQHYEEKKAPAGLISWFGDLFLRLGKDYPGVTLDELLTMQSLYSEEYGWMEQTWAVNLVKKLYDRLGRDTSGLIGY